MCRGVFLLIVVLLCVCTGRLIATDRVDAAVAAAGADAKPLGGLVVRGATARAIPLILVHGNGSDNPKHPQHRWDSILEWIRGNPVSFANYDVYDWAHDTSLPIGFNGTTGNARQLADFIAATFPRERQIILLAHSRGGLICRAYMNHDNQGDRVLRLITLGTPHHGTPLAVPDWAKAVVKLLYDEMYRPGSGLFDTARPGSLNLAWDNLDGAVQREKTFGRQLGLNSTDLWCLSPDDFNCPPRNCLDCTQCYTDQAKRENGTLAELNAREAYAQKIVAVAAYDPDLSDNRASAVELAFRNASEHDKLKWAVAQLCKFHECLAGGAPTYTANDGLVPLQSALFLDISRGEYFARQAGNAVQLDAGKIESRKLVRTHHILEGDHLDLLEMRDGRFRQMLYRELADAARKTPAK